MSYGQRIIDGAYDPVSLRFFPTPANILVLQRVLGLDLPPGRADVLDYLWTAIGAAFARDHERFDPKP